MGDYDITVTSPIVASFRVQQVAALYDMPLGEQSQESWRVHLPIEDCDWRIGLIVGPSGSGKTTLGRRLFGKEAYHTGFDWPADKAVVDGFGAELGIKEITAALVAVGFGSTPNWVRPFRVLSNGERFRAELARLLLEGPSPVVVDEFTSVVDRTVARIGSLALRKAVDRGQQRRQMVMLSCHDDVIEWLGPDWVYEMSSGRFTRRRLRRPELQLELYRSRTDAWRLFKKHHYLSSELHRSAQCFVGWYDKRPVALVATMPMMGKRHFWRESRLVVLPDFQGVGFGRAMSDGVARFYREQGCRYGSTTSHPAMIAYRQKSPHWRITRIAKMGHSRCVRVGGYIYPGSQGRAVVSAEYVGQFKTAQQGVGIDREKQQEDDQNN